MTSRAAEPPFGTGGIPSDAEVVREANELLEKIASAPRFTGSASEAAARATCANFLESEGFRVIEEKFVFSEFPGRYGAPLSGLLLIAFELRTIHVYRHHGGAGPAILFLALGLALTTALGIWLTRFGTSRLPWLRSQSANLVAVRGQPRVWLVAHLDSKSQTIPMLVRIASVVATMIAVVVLVGRLLADWTFAIPRVDAFTDDPWVQVLAWAAAIAAVPLVLCFTGDKSAGAVDNATGVVSVLLATRSLGARFDLGVIVTSGEELALAGARAHVAAHTERAIAINCDTIDDSGRFLCMSGRGARASVATSIARAAARLGLPLRLRGIIPGILADSIAFADAGWDAATLSRGNIATLARVHTSSDTRQRLTGSGIALASRLIAATVEELS